MLETLFSLPHNDPAQYSPLTLAYIGDAVYELVIRTILVRKANMQTAKLHKKATAYVRAAFQSQMAQLLEDDLTKEEYGVYHRGCNAKPATLPKSASREDYLKATGLEALVGYLYLQRRYERILQLVHMGFIRSEKKNTADSQHELQ